MGFVERDVGHDNNRERPEGWSLRPFVHAFFVASWRSLPFTRSVKGGFVAELHVLGLHVEHEVQVAVLVHVLHPGQQAAAVAADGHARPGQTDRVRG